MSSLSFKYKIVPYENAALSNSDGFKIPHTDSDPPIKASDSQGSSTAIFEETMRQIYYY